MSGIGEVIVLKVKGQLLWLTT